MYGHMEAPVMQLLRDHAELATEGGAVDKEKIANLATSPGIGHRQAALGAAGAAQAERGADAGQRVAYEGGP